MSNYEVKNVEPVAVSNDVQVRVFTLACGDVIPWHYHRESTDHYFVLRGTLTIETRGPDNRCVLPVGERHKILPGTAHRISNESASECQFLLVQGVGSTTGIGPIESHGRSFKISANRPRPSGVL
jgi:quercetin dioxygenase-like cupin family protein